MATIRIDIDGRDEVSQNIQSVRQRMLELNRTIAENRNRLVGANAEEAKRIRALNMANSAIRANLSVEMQELRLKQQLIAQTERETRAREAAARAQQRAAEQSRQASQQLTAGIAIAAGLAARELGQLTTGFIQAAANMETYRNSIQSVTGNTEETNRVLSQLLDLTVELVGIDTGTLISFAGRMMAAGLSAEEAIVSIRGVTERVAEQGKSAEVTARVLEQFQQAISSNTISMQDFRPIARELPTLFTDMSNAMGQPIRSLDDFRNAADAVGGPTQAILLLLEEMGRASEGANLNTLNAQMDILQDQARLLAAELGEHLIPAAVEIVRTLNGWIETFRNMDDEAQAAIAWATALATGIAGLTAVVGGSVVAFGAFSASLTAITGTSGLAGLGGLATRAAGGLGRVAGIFGRLGTQGNLAVTSLVTLAQTWNQIYNDFQRTMPFEDAVESLQALDLTSSQTAQSLGLTSEALSGLSQDSRQEIELLTERADQLRSAITSAVNRQDFQALGGLRDEYRQVSQQLETLTAVLPPTRDGLDAATTAITGLAQATPPAVRFTRELGESAETLEESFRLLTPSVEAIALAYQAAQTTAESLDTSMTDLENTLLTGADPLSDYADGLRLTSEAADAAFGTINNVGEAVRNADFRQAETDLTDLDDAFQRSEATIPRVTSAMREFTGTAPDVERVADAVDPVTRSVDDLLDSIDAVPSAVEMTTGAFEIFSDDAVRYINDVVRGFDPLFDTLGDVGDEVSNFTSLIANISTGNIPGAIANTLRIILPGLTDPQRILEFQQPVAGIDPQNLNLPDLGLNFNFGDAFANLSDSFDIDAILQSVAATSTNVATPRPPTLTELARRTAERTGTDRDFTENIARQQYGAVAYDAEVAAADAIDPEEVNRVAELARRAGELISDGQLRRSLSDATDTLNDLVQSGESVADLLTFLNTELVPLWNQEYQDMIDDLVDQGHTLEQAQDIVSAEHGTRSEFTQARVDAIITPITEANEMMARQVAERVSDGQRGRDIRTATDTLNDMIEAGSSVAGLQTFVTETLVPLWGTEYDDIVQDLVDQGHTLTQAESIVLAEQGTRSEFTQARVDAIITPITEANEMMARQVAERVSDNTLARSIRTATEGLEGLIESGASVAEVQAFITAELVPLWESQYQDMVQDLVDQGFTLNQATSLVSSEQGTVGEFTEARTAAIIEPIESQNAEMAKQVAEDNAERARQVAERVSDNTLARSIRTATDTLNGLIEAGNSVAEIQAFITAELVPLWNQEYQDMIDDLVEQGNTLTQAESIVTAEHGAVGEFTAGLTSAIIEPIQSQNAEMAAQIAEENAERAAQVAERVSDGQRSRDIRTATDTLNGMIEAGASVSNLQVFITDNLIPLWVAEYEDMIDDLVDQGHTLEQASAIVGAEQGAVVQFILERSSAIINPINAQNAERASRAAQQVADQNAERASQAAERISDGQRGRDIRTATDTLNGMIEAGSSVAELQLFINTELVPLWNQEYQDMVQDLVDQGHTLEQAQDIVSAEQGTQGEFTGARTSEIIDPITDANEMMARQVAERVSDGQRGRDIRTATDTLNDMIEAGDSVAEVQAFITAELVPLWESQYQDMIDDLVEQGNTLSDAQAIVSAEQGTQREFTGARTSAIIEPIESQNAEMAKQVAEDNAERARQVAERVSDNTLARSIRTATEGLEGLIESGASVAEVQAFITAELVPLWESQYQDMVQDLVDQGFTLNQATSLVSSEQGTVGEFTEARTAAIIEPIESQNAEMAKQVAEDNAERARQVAERVSDGQLSQSLRAATENLNELVSAGESINDLRSYITAELVPLWQRQYQDIVDDLVAQGFTLDQAQQVVTAEVGTAEEFITGLVSDVLTPITGQRSQTASALGQNRIRSARFNLGGATSESEFETLRTSLITTINEVYGAEEERIRGLGLTVGELQDQLEDNQFARDQAIRQATTLNNTFRESRIRAEEQAAEEETRLAEQAARERERIAEQQQREEERAIQARIREEMRLQDAIQDLRDDALAAEMDRQQRLLDLEEDTARRREDIERRTLRSQEDSRRDYFRDIEDLQNRLARSQFGVSSFRELSGQQVTELRGSEAFERGIFDIRQSQTRAFEDFGTREARGLEDAEIRQLREQEDINLRTEAELLEIQQETAALESETAAQNMITATTQTEAAQLQQASAMTLDTAAMNLDMAVDDFALIPQSFDSVVEGFMELPSQLADTVRFLTAGDIEQRAEPMTPMTPTSPQPSINAQMVSEIVGTAAQATASAISVRVENVSDFDLRPQVILYIDKERLAESMDETLVQRDQQGRTIGSYTR